MSGWPNDVRIGSLRIRAKVSTGPPAPYGTMKVTGRDGYGSAGAWPANNNVASAAPKNALFISLALSCTTHEASCLIARTYSSSGTATPKSSAILTLLLHTEGGSSTAGEPLRFSPRADMEPRGGTEIPQRGGLLAAPRCAIVWAAAPTPTPLPPEASSYATEPAVHPWTRG